MYSPELRRAYELIWYPGRAMHGSWWESFGIGGWASIYARSRFCRAAIDEMIRRRTSLTAIPPLARLTTSQTRLLSSERKMARVAVGLGLLAAGCREHLLLSSYRRALSVYLDEQDCEHIFAVSPVAGKVRFDLEADSIGALCEQIGLRWIDRDLQRDPVWAGLRLLVPAPDDGYRALQQLGEVLPDVSVLPSLERVGRLL